MSLSDNIHVAILEAIFNNESLSVTGPTKVRLHTGDPGSAGTANEVSTGDWDNYAAVDVNVDETTDPFWTAPATVGSNREVENNGAVDFGTAQITNPVEVTHFTVFDQAESVYIGGDALDTSQTINDGNPVSFPTGDLSFDIGPAA